ncbi:hypothetical protein ES703_104966 [subsurface metagenome]
MGYISSRLPQQHDSREHFPREQLWHQNDGYFSSQHYHGQHHSREHRRWHVLFGLHQQRDSREHFPREWRKRHQDGNMCRTHHRGQHHRGKCALRYPLIQPMYAQCYHWEYHRGEPTPWHQSRWGLQPQRDSGQRGREQRADRGRHPRWYLLYQYLGLQQHSGEHHSDNGCSTPSEPAAVWDQHSYGRLRRQPSGEQRPSPVGPDRNFQRRWNWDEGYNGSCYIGGGRQQLVGNPRCQLSLRRHRRRDRDKRGDSGTRGDRRDGEAPRGHVQHHRLDKPRLKRGAGRAGRRDGTLHPERNRRNL